MWQVFLLIITFVWVLALVKVFVLEQYATESIHATTALTRGTPFVTDTDTHLGGGSGPAGDIKIDSGMPSTVLKEKFHVGTRAFTKAAAYSSSSSSSSNINDNSNGVSAGKREYMPHSREWLLARSHQGGDAYNVGGGVDVHGVPLSSVSTTKNFKTVSVSV
jgi:hypothetical protein